MIPWYHRSLDFEKLWREFPPAPDYFKTVYSMPREELRTLQSERFVRQIQRAWEIPFYQRHWKKAGIKRGDVIASYDGKKIDDSSSLPSFVAATPVGKTVPVEVIRDGNTKRIDVTIRKLNDQTAELNPGQEKGEWGLALQNIRPQERRQMNLRGNEGVLVQAVMPGSPAANAGVQAGDVILQVNHAPVSSVEAVKSEAAKTKGDKPLLLLLRRADGTTSYAALSRNVG